MEKINVYLEKTQDSIDRAVKWFELNKIQKHIKETETFKGVEEYLTRDETLKRIYHTIKMSNHNNIVYFERNFGESPYVLDLKTRNRLVLLFEFIAFLFGTIITKRSLLKRLFYPYFIGSALICRENFDLRGYKFSQETINSRNKVFDVYSGKN